MIKSIAMLSASSFALRSDLAEGTGGATDQPAARSRVGALASVLDGDIDFALHVNEAVKAKEVAQYISVQAMNDLVDLFGEEELRTWPIIGTDEDDKPKPNNPERYKVWAVVNGERKERKTSFVKEIVAHYGRGKELHKIIDACNEAKADVNKTSHPVVSQMKRKEDRDAYKAEAEMEIGVIQATIRNGLKLLQKIWEFESLVHVKQSFLVEAVTETVYVDKNGHPSTKEAADSIPRRQVVLDAEGQPMTRIKRTPKPVKVFDALDTASFTLMSLSAFSNLDVDKIKLAGGTYDAFLSSRKRDDEGDEDSGNAEGQNVVVNNLATFETATAGWAGWLETDQNRELLFKQIAKAVKDKNFDTYGSLIESLREMCVQANAIWPAIDKAHAAMTEAQAKKVA